MTRAILIAFVLGACGGAAPKAPTAPAPTNAAPAPRDDDPPPPASDPVPTLADPH